MKIKEAWRTPLSGAAAGAVNGLFGAGGGMVLVPLLTSSKELSEDEVFPASVGIIFPICIVSLVLSPAPEGIPLDIAWPYLLGGAAGGLLAGLIERRIPTKWLHRFLGIMILWGGVRYLC